MDKEIFDLAPFIDHTLLKPISTEDEIAKLCQEGKQYRFASVCVPPVFVKQAAKDLKKAKIEISTVIGFPLGYNLLEVKMLEARKALKHGASELDVVMNLAEFKSGNFKKVMKEMNELSWFIHDEGARIKYIIETAYLDQDEMFRICEMALKTELDFIKTSTGYASSGAKLEDVKFLRANLPSFIKIKASGGIKTYQQAFEFVNSGADRIGTSNGIELVAMKVSS